MLNQNFPSFVLLLLCWTIPLSACQTQHVSYHSTADIPYRTNVTSTQLELVVGNEEAANTREYVVFVGADNRSTSYVLLAPYTANTTGAAYSFENANLGRAVPIDGENVDELMDALQQSIEFWEQGEVGREGKFVEFMHAPEQDIDPVSENVVEWRPAVKFTFSYVPDGPSARMMLGDSPEDRLQYVTEFDEREEVVDFRDVLDTARSRLE